MAKDSVLFRFREKDSREGITRDTLKKLASALDVSETAAMHQALVEYALQHVPQYPKDDGPLAPAQLRKISKVVRKKHGEMTVSDSLFEERAARKVPRAAKRIPAARGR
jgi:flagellar hook-length control protein FliK